MLIGLLKRAAACLQGEKAEALAGKRRGAPILMESRRREQHGKPSVHIGVSSVRIVEGRYSLGSEMVPTISEGALPGWLYGAPSS